MKNWIEPRITNLGVEETKDVEIGAPSVQYESNVYKPGNGNGNGHGNGNKPKPGKPDKDSGGDCSSSSSS